MHSRCTLPIAISILVLISAVLITACKEPAYGLDQNSLYIRVADSLSADGKTIAYDGSLTDGNAAPNAYRVLLESADGNVNYLDEFFPVYTDEFILSDVAPGDYRVVVQSVVRSSDGKTSVAVGRGISEPFVMDEDGSRIDVVIDTVLSGNPSFFGFRVYAPYGDYDPETAALSLDYGENLVSLSLKDGTLEFIGKNADGKGVYWDYEVSESGLNMIQSGRAEAIFSVKTEDGSKAENCSAAVIFRDLPVSGTFDMMIGSPISDWNVGDTVILDGIECVIIYDAGSEQNWGRYILADRNHDISYYLTGSDFQNTAEGPVSEYGFDGFISEEHGYGYEWGGQGITLSLFEEGIGKGLSNSDAFISMDFRSADSGYFMLWDKLREFREMYGEKWFVPSRMEMNELYGVFEQGMIEGITDEKEYNALYWTSTAYENSPDYGSFAFDITAGNTVNYSRNHHCIRARLCRYATDSEISAESQIIRLPVPMVSWKYVSTINTGEVRLTNFNLYKDMGIKEINVYSSRVTDFLDDDIPEEQLEWPEYSLLKRISLTDVSDPVLLDYIAPDFVGGRFTCHVRYYIEAQGFQKSPVYELVV